MDLKGPGDLGSNPYIWAVINMRIDQNRITAWWSFQPLRDGMILVRVQPFSNGYRGPRCGVRSQTTTIVVRFGLVSHNAAHYQRQRPFQCRLLQPFFPLAPFSPFLTLSHSFSPSFECFLSLSAFSLFRLLLSNHSCLSIFLSIHFVNCGVE